MLLLVSGEGATDIGKLNGNPRQPCCGEGFLPGPMAWFVDQITSGKMGYSFLESDYMYFVAETKLSHCTKDLKPPSLPGKRRATETAYFFRTARALACIARTLAQETGDEVVAVLFRDADGTQSAGRGDWRAKFDSMLNGFAYEGLSGGVPMLPKPKSEAWLLCALKSPQPYQNCAELERASGNDRSPRSLKQQLTEVLGQNPTREVLCDQLRSWKVDVFRIDMPSFNAFRERLEAALMTQTHNPSGNNT